MEIGQKQYTEENISYKKFSEEDDYYIMRNIVQNNCTRTGHLYPQLHIGNLDFERYAFEESPDTLYNTIYFICYKTIIIGFITIQENEFYITVSAKFPYFMNEILDYIENRFYELGTIITTEANSKDELLNQVLKERGYTKTDSFRFSGICDLSGIEQPIEFPRGIIIRLTEERDIERRAELFGLATGGRSTSPERYRRMMQAPSYCEAMDLIVENEDKEIIAYCTIWNDSVSKTSILEPVACAAEYRRKGIMKVALLYGMNQLRDRGTKHMYVGTGGGNKASQALYKSVGFVEYGINQEWQKIL